jgi:predicted enzyme related to lactoylglutathione lyase
MPNRHGEFIWYELITPDPDGAKAFYDAVMGWDVGPPSDDHMAYREIRAGSGHAGGMMQLTYDMAAHGARPTWLGYIGVDDVDQSVASIEQGGGKVLMPAFDIPNVGRIALVADPQGVPFYVMRGASEETSNAFSPTEAGHCSWNELATGDQAAALDFYTSRFGWTKGDVMPMGDMGDYQFITHHGVMLGAMMTAAPGNPSRWRFYFRGADVDAAKQAVEAGGGTVVHGPQEVPGGDRILIGTDPQGAEFAVVGK